MTTLFGLDIFLFQKVNISDIRYIYNKADIRDGVMGEDSNKFHD